VPRRTALLLAAAALGVLLAVPALAASPGPSGGPGQSGKPRVEKSPVSLSGTIARTTDPDGRASYTLQSGGTTYTLDAGPPWFHGNNHPLQAYVGKSVTITGERAAGSAEIDVKTVNGTALRAAGRPPWAGGWKRVGQSHPGWSQEKVDRQKAKFGDCFPPGHCGKPNPAASARPTS
jgi:hypothetical protein